MEYMVSESVNVLTCKILALLQARIAISKHHDKRLDQPFCFLVMSLRGCGFRKNLGENICDHIDLIIILPSHYFSAEQEMLHHEYTAYLTIRSAS